jgi:deoxyribose-phosphate aldolase
MTRTELARIIDHTLLAPLATADDVRRLVDEAIELEVGAVCVSPTMVAGAVRAAEAAESGAGRLTVCSVVGFPSGAHRPETKATEARRAQDDGATEIDMVIDLGAARAHDWSAVEAGVAAVRAAVDGLLKAIVESAALDPAELAAAGPAAVAGGADYLKTSTGFHPSGGASPVAVATLAGIASASDRPIGVKASGGIRDTATALAMIGAGATRIGCSSSRAILEGLDQLDPLDASV